MYSEEANIPNVYTQTGCLERSSICEDFLTLVSDSAMSMDKPWMRLFKRKCMLRKMQSNIDQAIKQEIIFTVKTEYMMDNKVKSKNKMKVT